MRPHYKPLSSMVDLVIRNCRLVDGTGSPARPADVGISGDRIEAIGSLPKDVAANTVIDAAGRVLSPGFVDIHTHSDLSLVADGTGESKLRQGVTTEVVGNCSVLPFSQVSRPSPAVVTSYPLISRLVMSNILTFSASSATRIFFFSLI